MTYFRDHWNPWRLRLAMILTIGPFGCSPLPRQDTSPELAAVTAEPNEAVALSEPITLSLNLKIGTKTRYRVTTEAVTAMENPEPAIQDNASAVIFPKVSEYSEVIFTQKILGPLPEDANTVVALITIDQVKYVRTTTGQPVLVYLISVRREWPCGGLLRLMPPP